MDEAEQFLKNNPDVRYVDVLNFDLCGIMRGKRIHASQLKKVYSGDILMPGTGQLLDVTGDSCDPDGRGFSDGDPDSVVTPIPGSLVAVPWKGPEYAQVLTTFYEEDGAEMADDPRHVLRGVLKQVEARGLKPVVACELEFFLIEPDAERSGPPVCARMPKSGQRPAEGQVYSMAQLDDYEDFLRDVAEACATQRVPAGPATTEFAAGQFEINLGHVDDAILACDHSALLQRIIRGVALNHGAEATFMAKPHAEGNGSGLHIHCSILDRDGNNVFDNGGDEGTDALRHAIGGMLDTMAESMAFCAPNVNSYRRFVPDAFVALAPTWSYNNRSTALRIPGGSHEARRFEHRIAGADANPYLVMSVMLAGVLHGLENRIEPPVPTQGDAKVMDDSIPRTWQAGLDTLENATVIPSYLGDTYCRRYRLVKQGELEKFYSVVTDREYEWYLISR